MSQFIANVKAKLDDTELKQLDNLKDKTVDVKVNLTGDGANFIKSINAQLNSVSNTASQAGAKAGSNFRKSLEAQITNMKNTEQRLSNRLSNLQNFSKSGQSVYGNTYILSLKKKRLPNVVYPNLLSSMTYLTRISGSELRKFAPI